MTDHPQPQVTLPADKSKVPISGAKSPMKFTHSKWQILAVIGSTGMVGLLTALTLPFQMSVAATLMVFCIGMWITSLVPAYWTALKIRYSARCALFYSEASNS